MGLSPQEKVKEISKFWVLTRTKIEGTSFNRDTSTGDNQGREGLSHFSALNMVQEVKKSFPNGARITKRQKCAFFFFFF